jgi:hypothetical protein
MMNHTELAKALGISREMVHRHVKAGRLSQESGGGFDADKARAQLSANVRKKNGGSPRKSEPTVREARESGGPNLAKAQLAHELVRVRKASLELGQLEATLGDMAEAGAKWQAVIVTVRNELLRVRHTVAARFGEEIGAFVDKEIRRILRELSEFDWRPVYLQVDQERQGALNR